MEFENLPDTAATAELRTWDNRIVACGVMPMTHGIYAEVDVITAVPSISQIKGELSEEVLPVNGAWSILITVTQHFAATNHRIP